MPTKQQYARMTEEQKQRKREYDRQYHRSHPRPAAAERRKEVLRQLESEEPDTELAELVMSSMADEIQAMRNGVSVERLKKTKEYREEERRQRNLEACRKYREEHRKERRESDRRYRAKHRDEINARRRARAKETTRHAGA